MWIYVIPFKNIFLIVAEEFHLFFIFKLKYKIHCPNLNYVNELFFFKLMTLQIMNFEVIIARHDFLF